MRWIATTNIHRLHYMVGISTLTFRGLLQATQAPVLVRAVQLTLAIQTQAMVYTYIFYSNTVKGLHVIVNRRLSDS